jgi:hypothetical protein
MNSIRNLVISTGLLLLSACVPASSSPPNYAFETLPRETGQAMVRGFGSVLRDLEIQITLNPESALRYSGSDSNAFLFIVDRFYQQNPGFCPLEKSGFHPDSSGKVFLTLAAKGLEVRGFVYDLSSRPAVTFTTFSGSSRGVLKTQPCRTVATSPP